MSDPEQSAAILKVRLSSGLRSRIEAAARSRGASLNAEVVTRLAHSFRDADMLTQALELAFGERTADLLLQLGKVMRDGGAVGESVSGNAPQPDGWMANPVAYEGVTRGVSRLFERLRPAGDRVLPRNPKLNPGAADLRQDLAAVLADRLADAWEREYGVAQRAAPSRRRRDLVDA
jgi:Arc-like DNA binding domain